ncbi:MAG: biotin carboxylase [Planctomycetota bacterium]|jgi:biotin carboxylase
MNQRPLVLLAAGRSQLPLIERANQLGFETWAFDQEADSVGAAAATRFGVASARDADAVLAQLRPWALEQAPAGILTGSAAPGALLAASLIGGALKLPTTKHTALKKVLDRGTQRTALIAAHVPVPPATIVLGEEEAMLSIERLGRAVLKPAAGTSGSAGVAFATPGPELELRVRAAAAAGDGRIVIEEIVEGDEYSIDAFALADSTQMISITRKETASNPPLPMGFSTVSPTAEERGRCSLFFELVDMVAKGLNLKHTAFNLDVICTDAGPVVIEVGCFLDAKIDRLLHFGGRDVYGALCQVAVGETPTEWKPLKEGLASRFLFTSHMVQLSAEQMKSAEDLVAAEGAVLEWQIEAGDEVRTARSLSDTLGWILCKGKTGEDARELSCSLSDKLINLLGLN